MELMVNGMEQLHPVVNTVSAWSHVQSLYNNYAQVYRIVKPVFIATVHVFESL